MPISKIELKSYGFEIGNDSIPTKQGERIRHQCLPVRHEGKSVVVEGQRRDVDKQDRT